jgi:hypothetical protein
MEDFQVDFEDDQNQLAVIVQESGLEESKAKYILNRFQDYFTMADEWAKTSKQIVVTDASQTHLMDMARAARLVMREKRLEIEKSRKELKEQSLREGKAIDGIANVLKALIIPLEEYYAKQENFVELKAAEKAKLIEQEVQERLDKEFEAQQKAKAEADARIRAENEALKEQAYQKEQELVEERKRVAYEQEKIKKENEAKIAEENRKRQAELDLVRKENEVKLAKERAEREKLEAELLAKKQAEWKAEADRIRKEEELKKAGDREKLTNLANDLGKVFIPIDIKSKDAKTAIQTVENLLHQAIEILKLATEDDF